MKKKILFVVQSLSGGGAERIISMLAAHLDRSKFEVHLALLKKDGPYLKDIPSDVQIHDLKVQRVRWSFLPMLFLVWNLKPHVVLSTLGHLNIALAMLKPFLPKATKLILRESNTVSEEIALHENPSFWKWLYQKFYPKADLVICQSRYMKRDLEENFGISPQRAIHIYNPVDAAGVAAKSLEGENPFAKYGQGPHILGIGRLEKQKGLDRLIQLFPRILNHHPNAHLWILGMGALEDELKYLVHQQGTSEKVHFVGFQNNPWMWMKHADLFVLSSKFEGLPNVLLEALAVGCPVLALKHPGGTEEIMELCGIQDRYAEKLDWENHYLLKMDVYQIHDRLKKYFGLNDVVEQYTRVMEGESRL